MASKVDKVYWALKRAYCLGEMILLQIELHIGQYEYEVSLVPNTRKLGRAREGVVSLDSMDLLVLL